MKEEKGMTFWRSAAIGVKVLVTMLLAAMCVTTGNVEMEFFFAITILLWIPLLLLAFVITICNVRMRDTYQRVVFLWGVGNLLLFGLTWWLESRQADEVEVDGLVAHYCEHERELWTLADYTRSAMDSGAYLDLEFDGDKVEHFHTRVAGGEFVHRWKTDGPIDAVEVGATIGLTADEIEGIRQRLKAAGCISISLTNYGPDMDIGFPMTIYGMADSVTVYGKRRRAVRDVDIVKIGRKRYMLSAYYYNLYRYPMNDSTWNHLLLDDYTRIPICDTMALEYGSPAFGSECYPLKEEIVGRLNLKEK